MYVATTTHSTHLDGPIETEIAPEETSDDIQIRTRERTERNGDNLSVARQT